MEVWFIFLVSLCVGAVVKLLLSLFSHDTVTDCPKILPPGPPSVPIISSFYWLCKSLLDLEPILRDLRTKYGPIVKLPTGSTPTIFITNHELAHKAIVQHGATFADRPPALPHASIFSSNQHNIGSAKYGPLWRLLRRNIITEILHPSRVKSYGSGRKWVLDTLINKLKQQAESGEPVRPRDHFRYSMFGLLAFMCFGEKLDEKVIRDIEEVEQKILINFNNNNILAFMPRLGKFLFRKRWNEVYELQRSRESVLLPLVRARQEKQMRRDNEEKDKMIVSYVDTLLDLRHPDGGRRLTEVEMVNMCGEFLGGGSDTTSTTLQWIMANLVKHPEIQSKLCSEIEGVVGSGEEIKEEDLQKMPYLKAVVLEGLRRHPPAHFLLPHAVTEEIKIDGYVVPKNSIIYFMVAEMGWDPKVWEDPMEFKPERFLGGGDDGGEQVFDITGSREIKMMPFGAGRRICAGFGLALLHLECFVANLVREFEWTAVDGEEVDLSEKLEFTVVMKNPLRAHISPRMR
ncbi:PREDICTED: cytochrome P450 89A2-like [Nelumbo nucifera]|uniref:Cytochrome P450 89A2-like n=2 Tax=Nelumbo nucifera TaxID=4432 RepID=A0A822XTI1_NELNU|nr:PREDICTED: cytochrome P450 89A2-like [Nelumbo nucifera]DAD24924.1 TPA_asm: hypothetical protein HUJ06_026388 [Nelumbo nucifera]